MILQATAPSGWDERIEFPLQSVGFADAARALGHQPFFAEDARGLALVLVRRVPVRPLAPWTARAKVYAHAHEPDFVPALVERLRGLGVSHVRLGDSAWGLSGARPPRLPGVRPRGYHVFVHDLTVGEDRLLARTHRMIRRHLRKFAGEVTVSQVRTERDLRDYLALAAETATRMRVRDVAAAYTPAYFEAIFREMVPRQQAVLFLARTRMAPLAAAAFVMTRDRFTQLHGCSTRDRALTPKQGPTFIFWHAMRYAQARGCRTFDMGAVTPTDDPGHPHYSVYEYKKLWGGELREVQGAELIVSPWKYRFQEFVLAPMWDRLHPLYLRVFGDGPRPAGVPRSRRATAVLDLSTQEQHP